MAFTADIDMAGLNTASKPMRSSVCVFSEIVTDDSNKTLDFSLLSLPGALQSFLLTGVKIQVTCTAVSGTRSWEWNVLDAAGLEYYTHTFPSNYHGSASESYKIHCMIGAAVDDTSDDRSYPMPDRIWLRPDWRIQIRDSAAIDATGDDMIVRVLGIAYWL